MKFIISLLLASLISFQASAQELHPTGLIVKDVKKSTFFKKSDIQVKYPSAYVDHTSQMPPVGNQGSLGSCVGWASGYYYKTQQEYLDYGWNVADSRNICSPAFMYNHINGGADYGADFEDAFKLLTDNGCASIYEFPYTTNFTNWPSEQIYLNALKFRCSEAFYINTSTVAGLNQVRQYVSDGNCAVIGIPVYPNFDNIQSHEYTYCLADVSGSIRGYHAVTIVGYDDSKVTHDGTGAFKLVNSWGLSWGMQGYFWMSYEAVMSSVLTEQTAYYATDKIHYSPSFIARAKFTHGSRNKFGIKFGIGSQSSPSWSKSFFNFNMGSNADKPFPNNNIVFDLSDGAAGISQTESNQIWLCASDTHQDNFSGTVNYFSASGLDWSMTSVSSETPLSVPDYTQGVYAHLLLGPNYTANAGVRSVDMPAYSVPGNVVPKATVRNFGRNTAGFNLTISINQVSDKSTVYTNTVSVSGVAPGENRQVTLDGWNALPGNYRITAYTTLQGDQNQNDDTCRADIIIVPLPQIPVLVSPAAGGTGLLTDVSFKWNKSANADLYCFQISYDSLFSDIVAADSLLTDSVKNVYSLHPLTDYYWRVKGKNGAGTGSFSPARTFRTLGFPNAVSLCSPAENSVGVSVPVTFTWRRATEQIGLGKLINNYLLQIVADTVSNAGQVNRTSSDTLIAVNGLTPYTVYYWRVSAKNEIGWGAKSPRRKFTSGAVGILPSGGLIPQVYKLYGNYPNPFNPSTVIKFDIPEDTKVSLKIYDISGRELASVKKEFLKAGSYSFEWNASVYSSGVYFYRLQTDRFTDTGKMILIK
ncbi:MAG: T9SS type A sorting domain-containing protein [Bacteroidetes bacterium]|nr:T9SS type A sorting domain-containing protein [Bacteroidota bacterium]